MKHLFIAAIIAFATVPAAAQTQDGGLELWNKIHEVFSHPRCANCHVGADNIPVWSGPSYGGEARLHGMNINAGPSRIGAETLPCSTCHMKQNAQVPHGPPGADVWALPPVEMQWADKSSAQICAQIKDPNRNGGRTLAEVADHVDHDELVHWGWSPGPGREPAPYSFTELVTFIKQWDALGAPCPAG